MSATTLSYTLWPGLYDTIHPEPVTETWDQITARLSVHQRAASKERVPGFGPYALKAPHRRRDDCVAGVTMLVFDVDHGSTPERVQATRTAIQEAGVAQHWYSSFSHTPEIPKYRLVIPFKAPLPGPVFAQARRRYLELFRIPADPSKCGAWSHFYFLPSAPPEAAVEVFTAQGNPLDVDPTPPRQYLPRVHAKPVDLEPPPMTGPVDMAPLLATLQERATTLRRRGKAEAADYLERALEGRALAPDGNREQALRSVCMVMANALGPIPREVFRAILGPSVEAMRREGSSKTLDDAFDRYHRGVRKVAQEKADKDALLAAAKEARARWAITK